MSRRLSVVVTALLMAALAIMRDGATASAGVAWCWDDPTPVIGGQAVHIDPGVALGQAGAVTSSALTVLLPSNVAAHLSGTSARTFPIGVSLARSGSRRGSGDIPVTAQGVVNAGTSVSTGLKAWQSNGTFTAAAHGTSGATMQLQFGVRPSGRATSAMREARRQVAHQRQVVAIQEALT